MRLSGRRIVVTGGSRGIGRAIAVACGREGPRRHHLCEPGGRRGQVVADRSQGGVAMATAMTSAIASACAGLAILSDAFGSLDALVNNAGINRPTDFDRISDDDWDEILAVNLRGPFVCAQGRWSISVPAAP